MPHALTSCGLLVKDDGYESESDGINGSDDEQSEVDDQRSTLIADVLCPR